MNISEMKVMRCAWDVAPKEAAVDPCSVCERRVCVNLIHCPTCGYWVHGQCLGVQEGLARVAQGFVYRGGGRQAADEFRFKDVDLECVGKFVYLAIC